MICESGACDHVKHITTDSDWSTGMYQTERRAYIGIFHFTKSGTLKFPQFFHHFPNRLKLNKLTHNLLQFFWLFYVVFLHIYINLFIQSK